MAATIVDIAKKAGVGEATVVRALRGSGYVSKATKARVLKVAAEMDYRPNRIARSLALGKSEFVAIVAPAFGVNAVQPYIGPIEQGIRAAGYSMLFYLATSPSAELDCFEEVLSKRAAGVIVMPASLNQDPKPYQMLVEKGVKMAIMDKTVEGVPVPQIMVDHYKSGRLAAEHLIGLGHRDIVYLAIPRNSRVGNDRARGFLDAMTNAGIPTEGSIIEVQENTEEAGKAALADLLKRPHMPTAVVARHDLMAIGVMQAAFAAGLPVPEDLSLVGHGNMPIVHALRAPLTSVQTPTDKLSKLAVEKVFAMLAGEEVPPEVTVLDVELMVRGSTAPPHS